MYGMRSKGALLTGARVVEYDQFANVSPGDPSYINCGMSGICAWGRFRLRRSMFLALIVVAIVTPWASGLAAPGASTEAQNPPQTTTIQRTAPAETEPVPDRDSQEPTEWSAQTWLALMTIVALLSFLVGRAWAPPPKPAAVRTAVEKAFEVRRHNADVHSFPEAVRVLHQAETEVLEVLKKLKVIP